MVNNENSKPLIDALHKRDDTKIKQLIKEGVNVDTPIDKHGTTILMKATEDGEEKILLSLIELGADVNIIEKKDNQSPLLLACWEGHEEIVRILIEHGADVFHKKKGDKTSLMYAAHSGSTAIVKMILEKGVDVNAVNDEGQSAFMYAADDDKKTNIAALLIEHDADINQQDNEGKTAIKWAAYHGSLNMVKLFLEKGAEISSIDTFGQSIRDFAKNAKINSEEILSLLTEYGARELPLCYGYKLHIDCPDCGRPVIINGPLAKIKCGACLSSITLNEEFWNDLIKSASDEGSSSTVFGSYNYKLEYRRMQPLCYKCEEGLDIAGITTESKGLLTCQHCGEKNAFYTAPDWLQDFIVKNQRPEYVICAEEEGSDDNINNDSKKPVAIACISCGAPLTITVETPRNATCTHCDMLQYLPDPLWHSLHPIKKTEQWYIKFKDGKD